MVKKINSTVMKEQRGKPVKVAILHEAVGISHNEKETPDQRIEGGQYVHNWENILGVGTARSIALRQP